MSTLPDVLAPLTALDHWVVWRLEKRRNGKLTKPPYQLDGQAAKSDDPNTWTTYAAAAKAADRFDGTGFMLLDSGVAAFDLDHCRDPATGAIDPWALAVVDKSGSYAEITPSSTGLRIIGYGSGEKVHRKLKVPNANGVSCEIYRRATRFITVSGNVYRDAPLVNIDATIDAVLDELDTKKAGTNDAGGERDLPPALATMLSVRGSGGYPSRSELLFAFLTGAVRAKVADDVIIAACLDASYAGGGIFEHVEENGGHAYVERQIVKAREPHDEDEYGDTEVSKLNETYALVIVGDKSVVMKSADGMEFLTVATFKEWFGNRFVRRNQESIPLAKFWLTHPERRQYEGLVFSPRRDVPNKFNLWRGFAVTRRPGDCSKFLAHLHDNVCSNDEELYQWVVGWFAQIFQQPENKMGTSLVLRGKQGVGKTKVGEVIGSLIVHHYVLVSDPRYVTGRFNSHLTSCLLLHADEGFWAGDHAAEGKLKDLITGKHHFIEYKGKEPIRVSNYVRLLVSGNPDWLVPAGFEERRFATLDVGERHIADNPYFAAIDKEMDDGGREALLDHLMKFDLSTVDLRTIPKTAALLEQKLASMSPEQGWWLDTLARGELPWGTGEPGRCPAFRLFDRYVKHASRHGTRRRSIEVQLGMFLRKHVPGLTKNELTYKHWNGTRMMDAAGAVYTFPALAICREEFAKTLGHDKITWDKKTAWTTEPPPDPELVPF